MRTFQGETRRKAQKEIAAGLMCSTTLWILRRRFDDELIQLLLMWKWWDKPTEDINSLIPLLTNSDIEYVKAQIKLRLE